jgi:hypothetical protein
MMKHTLSTLSIAALAAATFLLPAAASATTREQVRAELEQAYAQGALATQQNIEFVESPSVTGDKSRAQIRAELEQAYAQNDLGTQRNGEFIESTAVTSKGPGDGIREEATRAAKVTGERGAHSGS